MNDQTIPADQVREIVEKMYHHANHDNVRGSEEEYVRFFARQLDELLPPPPRPTLADMTDEERDECKWMQADVADRSVRYVIANPHDRHGEAALIAADGKIEWFLPEYVTPRPDLPRMEWPAGQDAEEAGPVKVGDVIESADDARLAALPAGSALLDCDGEAVSKRGEEWVGIGYIPIPREGDEFGPWKVINIGQKADQ